MGPKNAESSQCQTLRDWQQQCSVTRLDLTTQMIPAQTLVSGLVRRMTKKLNWNNSCLRTKKMSMESCSRAFQWHSRGLVNQLNSRTTCIEMFKRRSLFINRKLFFQDISLRVLNFDQKRKAKVHSQPKLCNYSIISSFPLKIFEI